MKGHPMLNHKEDYESQNSLLDGDNAAEWQRLEQSEQNVYVHPNMSIVDNKSQSCLNSSR